MPVGRGVSMVLQWHRVSHTESDHDAAVEDDAIPIDLAFCLGNPWLLKLALEPAGLEPSARDYSWMVLGLGAENGIFGFLIY